MRRWLLIPLVASLAAVSFYESWRALNEAAIAAEIPDPRPWPWAVDGFILVMALMVVFAAIDGHSWGTWWPRLGLLGATALSTGIQAAWAPLEDWAWALHAWSPLAVLSSFECLVWLVFGQAVGRPKMDRVSGPPLPARAHAWLASWRLPEEVPATRLGPPVGSSGHEPALPVARLARRATGPISGRDRAKVAAWRAEDPPRSARWIAEQLGLKGGQGREQVARLIEELRAAPVGGPDQNGERP